MFYKIVVLKDFAKFTGKHLCWSFFVKRRACNSIKKSLRACSFIKNRFEHQCFPMNFMKFLKTPLLYNTSGRLLVILVMRDSLNVFLAFSTSPPHLFLNMFVTVFLFSKSFLAGRPFSLD